MIAVEAVYLNMELLKYKTLGLSLNYSDMETKGQRKWGIYSSG